MKTWQGKFGKDYTDRNFLTPDQMDLDWKKKFGITRTQANKIFLRNISRSLRMLEIGCNIGNQLLCLQKMGFKNLYGIELQSYAIKISKPRTKGINIIQGSALDAPFKNSFFNLAFTSGLLIHIPPSDVNKVLDEIHRCARHYIWGCEYYSEKYEEIKYQKQTGLLWKADFAQFYLRRFHDLELIREERYKYLDSDNLLSMFLLRRKEG